MLETSVPSGWVLGFTHWESNDTTYQTACSPGYFGHSDGATASMYGVVEGSGSITLSIGNCGTGGTVSFLFNGALMATLETQVNP